MAQDPTRRALIDGRNEELSHEYTAIISYLLFSRLVGGPLRPELSTFLESGIVDELEHAKLLAHKVVALGGTPATEPAAVTLTTDNREMLQLAAGGEGHDRAAHAADRAGGSVRGPGSAYRAGEPGRGRNASQGRVGADAVRLARVASVVSPALAAGDGSRSA